MKPCSQYLAEFKSEYKFTLKLAVPEVTDADLDALEKGLVKYEPSYASAFRSTPIQANPLDFPNVKNTPVHTADITLKYPATTESLANIVANSIGISRQLVAVYSENDPRKTITDLFLERNDPDREYVTAIGNLEGETEHVPYGDEYNMNFLKEINGIKRLVRKFDSPLNGPDPKSMAPKDFDTFNDGKTLKDDTLGLFGRVKKEEFKRK